TVMWHTRSASKVWLWGRATHTTTPWQIANQQSASISRLLARTFYRPNHPCWKRSSPRLMPKFPVDAPKRKVVRALEILGFRIIREHEHIAMIRDNSDGTRTPLTMPNHSYLKSSTLRTICTQAGISRE